MSTRILYAIFLAVGLAVAGTGTGVANAEPVSAPSALPFGEEQIIPNMSNCHQPDLRERASCAAALVNGESMEMYGQAPGFGFMPHPIAIGITQVGLDPNGQPDLCAYASGVFENLYCNGVVHLGEGKLGQLNTLISNGQLAIALLSAHEWGHFVQSGIFGVNLTPQTVDGFLGGNSAFPWEHQADCLMGVQLSRWVADGVFPASSLGMAHDLFNAAIGGGDPAHGTSADVNAALDLGYHGGGNPAVCGDPRLGLPR